MRKKIYTKEDVDKTIDEVAETFRRLVCSTMGPEGQNIMLHTDEGRALITKDGVTVANAIDFEEPEKKIVAEIIKEAASRTNMIAGDGTTTSIAITTRTIQEIGAMKKKGYTTDAIRKNILENRDLILAQLLTLRCEFSDWDEHAQKDALYKIAMISTNGDIEISKCISESVYASGEEGIITVKNTYGKAHWEVTDGIKIPNARFAHAEFVRGSSDQTMKLKDVAILLTTFELEDAEMINLLNASVLKEIRKKNKTLLIIAKSGKSFLENMIKFNSTGQLKNCIVQPPYFGEVGREMLDDIAAYVSATVIDPSKGHDLSQVTMEHLGFAKEAVINKDQTTLYKTTVDHQKLDGRLALLKEAHKLIVPGVRDDRKVKERLASLTGNVFILNVPKISNIEDGERLDRVEDAINACRGALEGGYLPGCGFGLIYAFEKSGLSLKNGLGYHLFKGICDASHDEISRNVVGGMSNDKIKNMVLEMNDHACSYNFRTNKAGGSLEIGVIDSYKVVKTAFTNGISVGLTLSTCNGIIANSPEPVSSSPFDFEY